MIPSTSKQKEITLQFVYDSLISLTGSHFSQKWLIAPSSEQKKKKKGKTAITNHITKLSPRVPEFQILVYKYWDVEKEAF